MNRRKVSIQVLLYFFMLMFLMVTVACGSKDDDTPAPTTSTYTVTFNSQSATVAANPTSITVTSPATTVGTLPTEPTLTGSYFAGWWTGIGGNGKEFTASTVVTKDITVYAYWSTSPVSSVTAHRVYVSNYNDNSISVIDSATDGVIKTISLSHKGGVSAFMPDLNKLYVSGVTTSDISVINTLTNTVITKISLPGRAGSIVADSTTKKIFVAEHGDEESLLPLGTRVWVIDAESIVGTSYDYETITVGTNIQDLAIDTLNRRVFLTDFHTSADNPGLIFPINADTNTALTGITCGKLPHGDAVHSARQRAYATNLRDNNVTVINTSDNTFVTTIAVGNNPEGIAVDETIDRAVVTDSGPQSDSGDGSNDTVTLIDTSTNTIVGSPISVGDYPVWVATDSSTHKAYVLNLHSNTVSVVNLQTGVVVNTITVGNGPIRLTVVE